MEILLKYGPLILKGLDLIVQLVKQGKDFMPVVEAMKKVATKKPEEITEDDLNELETDLDRQVDEFLKPLDRKK